MDKPKKDYRLLVKPIIVVLVIVLILGYSILKIKNLAIGPEITLYSPTDGASAKTDLVNIKGKAERISQIFLNGKKIYTDESGNFDEQYLLANGYNLLEVSANDQFGRKVAKKLQLVFNNPDDSVGAPTLTSGLR